MFESDNHIDHYDFLKLRVEPKLTILLEQGEKIIFSSNIIKFNSDNKGQQRIFLLTNYSVLNILKSQNIIKSLMRKLINFQNKYSIKRRISLQIIYGITTSSNKNSNGFLLHVCKEHDYNYTICDRKMILLKMLSVEFQRVNKRPLPFYFKDQLALVNYCTYKTHIKENKQIKPKQNPHYLNADYFNEYKFDDKEYNLQYSENNRKVKITNFTRIEMSLIQQNRRYFQMKQENCELNLIQKMISRKQYMIAPSYCFSSHHKLFLFIPFIFGGNIINILQEKIPLHKQQLLFYAALIINFLQKIKHQNIIYCNLILENIYVKENGYLAFDGLEKDIRQYNISDLYFQVKGYNAYFSPQIVMCEGYGKQIDIWKAGICLYYLATGRFPFTGNNIKQIYTQIIEKTIQDEVPSYVIQMLEKDKHKRITVQELKEHYDLQYINWLQLKSQTLKAPFMPNSSQWKGKIPIIYELHPNPQ